MKKTSLIIAFLTTITITLKSQNFDLYVLSGNEIGATSLFDNNTQTGWFPGWNIGDYPVSLGLEWDSVKTFNVIKIYDWFGSSPFKIIVNGDTISGKLSVFDGWNTIITKTYKTNSVIFMITEMQGEVPITELHFEYDLKIDRGDDIKLKGLTGDALRLGTNGFHWIPTNLIPVPNIRVYQMSGWTWTEDGVMFEPTLHADGNYDSYYKELNRLGVNPIPCINKIPEWFNTQPNDAYWADLRFSTNDFKSDNPMAYYDIAKYAWQFAARYGQHMWPSTFINVNQTPRWNGDAINVPKSGLNLIKYIEIENEPNRPWMDSLHRYTPEQFAAFMSAIYDGHCRTMGDDVGITNADPNMKVIMSGLAGMDLVYIQKMVEWCQKNRPDKKVPFDVVNVHYYCNSAGNGNIYGGNGVSPEIDNLDYSLTNLRQFVDQNVGTNKEVWFTEFGYDTQECTTILCNYPELYGKWTAEELQAEWNLRTFLIAIASGIDKSFVYNLCDEDSAPLGYVFGSSGMLKSSQEGYLPKTSFDRTTWLTQELNGFIFTQRLNYGFDTWVLEFKNKRSDLKYFYWKGTMDGSTNEITIKKNKLIVNEKVQLLSIPKKKIIDNKDKKNVTPTNE